MHKAYLHDSSLIVRSLQKSSSDEEDDDGFPSPLLFFFLVVPLPCPGILRGNFVNDDGAVGKGEEKK